MKDEMRECRRCQRCFSAIPVDSFAYSLQLRLLPWRRHCFVSFAHCRRTESDPQRFHVRIGGFMGRTYEVQLQDGSLRYTTFGRGHNSEPVEVRPTMEQWGESGRELDAIGVWRWRAEYQPPA